MPENILESRRARVKTESSYSLAGWLSIAQAVIFPLSIFLGIIQKVVGERAFGHEGPMIGPTELLMLLFTAMAIYTLWRFKTLLNERYDFKGVDMLIHLSIALVVLNQLISLGTGGFAMLTGIEFDRDNLGLLIPLLGGYLLFMLTAGVIDIIIAVRLLAVKDSLGDLFKAFAVVTLIMGILEATVILSFLAALLVPIWCVIMGMIFFKDEESADFV